MQASDNSVKVRGTISRLLHLVLGKVLIEMEHQATEMANQVRQLTAAMESQIQQFQQYLRQRDIQLAELRGTVAAIQNAENNAGSNRWELLDPKIMHIVQTFDGQRASGKSSEFQ